MKRLFLAASALSVLSAPAIAQSPEDGGEAVAESRLETIIVQSRAQKLYRVPETTSGKLPTAPLDSSQVITVINSQLIEDQGARDAKDLYRNIPGVTVFSYAGVTARGFRQEEIFFDGLRGDPYAGFSVPQLFNVERVEFLKGPTGMLYGPGAPGGLFNYVTKKPSDTFRAEATAVVGTEARYGGSVEVEGPLGDGIASRFGVFYEDRNTPRRNTADEAIIYDGGLEFDVGFGDLLLQYTRYEQNLQGNRLRGVPVDDLGRFLTDRRWNHNEPGDFLDLVSNNFQAALDGRIAEGLTYEVKARYTDSREDQEYHEPRALVDTDGDGLVDTVGREFRDQTREEDGLTFGANTIWTETLGAVENRLMVGVEYFDGEQVFDYAVQRFGDVPPISLFDPQYGEADRETYNLTVRPTSTSEQRREGLYLLEEATLGRWTGVVGVRFDSFEDTSGDESFEDEAVTWRGGLIYRLREDVSLFAQWAESYEPQGIGDQAAERGGPFDPTEGEIIEGGIKTALLDGRIQGTATIYEIVRTNILQPDPAGDRTGDGVDDLISFGEITSQGLELEITADITDNWVFTGSYAYNETEVTADAGTSSLTFSGGDQFANAPKHQAGFWTRYQVPRYNLAFALGGDYVDVRESLSGQKVRPYTIFDASVIYDAGPVNVLLRADNLFDETYAASGFIERTGHFPGDPRSIFLEVSRTW